MTLWMLGATVKGEFSSVKLHICLSDMPVAD